MLLAAGAEASGVCVAAQSGAAGSSCWLSGGSPNPGGVFGVCVHLSVC